MKHDTLDTIGKKLTGGERRDAVHFAVAPVRVQGFLRAGDRVKFIPDSTEIVAECAWDEKPIGIIDPFLDCGYVTNNDRCWLFLFPNSITGLRHEWTHPAFPDHQTQPVSPRETSAEYSERWLRGFAEKYNGDYDEMIRGVTSGEGAFFGQDLEYSDFRPGTEFWVHISAVTGQEFTAERIENVPFRCAC